MNKKSLQAIEKIIISIYELKYLTQNKTPEYFYEHLEMNILCDLVSEIENNIRKISKKIKNKYDFIDWQLIEKEKHNDEILGKKLTNGNVCELAFTTLNDKFLENMLEILETEIPHYYKQTCNKRSENKGEKQ